MTQHIDIAMKFSKHFLEISTSHSNLIKRLCKTGSNKDKVENHLDLKIQKLLNISDTIQQNPSKPTCKLDIAVQS